MDWFRFYHDALDDDKVDALDGETYKRWVKLLCLASQQPVRGVLPPVTTVAFRLRIPLDDARDLVKRLRRERLIDAVTGGSAGVLHNWNKRQRQSDDSAERQRKRRSRDESAASTKEVTAPSRDVSRDKNTTAPHKNVTTHARGPDSDSETDSETELPLNPPSRASTNGAHVRGSVPADALWDAVAAVCGKATTKSQIQKRVEVCQELRDAEATPDDIKARATEWARRYQAPLTDKTLAGHWGALANTFTPPPRNGTAQNGAYLAPGTAKQPPPPKLEMSPEDAAASDAERKRVKEQMTERGLIGRVSQIGKVPA